MSKKKIAGIIVGCIIAIIVVIVLVIPPLLKTPTYTLSVSVNPPQAGSVSPSGGKYKSGLQITLTATPTSGYTFDYWDGAASGSSNTVTITMNSNKTITARFKVVEPEPSDELGTLTVHFIDVGQGDSILLDLGDTEVLIDGGKESPGVVNYIDDYVDGSLEVMIATHAHADHMGGLIAVLNAFEVDEIWLNGDTSPYAFYSQFMSAVSAEGAQVHEARRGDTIQAGNLTFDVLHPVNLSGTINNNSIVLSLSYGQIDFLFTGDAEQEAEASMLAEGIVADVEILKVGHHGSRTASTMQFLQVSKPECAIYMAGQGNSYGHPHQETITNLCEIGAEIYGTDIHGTVIITTDGETYNLLPSNNVPPVVCSTSATYDLTISVNGQGTTNPSVGTYNYNSGTQVTITASPASGWKFDHWSGDASGTSPTIVITVDSDKDGTAYFEEETSIGSNVQITYIFYDGVVPSTESDEYVEITNLGDTSQDLEGWVLKDISEGYPSLTFPTYILQPGKSIRVYTNEIHPEYGGFSFGSGKAVWNNSSPDTAVLKNTQGQEVSRKSY
jgi:beta-lactamase superfamily II metal-dependent hydrolase